MTIPGKLLIAAIAAVITSLLFAIASKAGFALLLGNALLAAIIAVLASHRALPVPDLLKSDGRSGSASTSASEQTREDGTVKWFNATKGFGFLVRTNGEEVFVHYRSIRGSGRRSLRDGQRVRFHVEQTDKGPQAEDVEELDA